MGNGTYMRSCRIFCAPEAECTQHVPSHAPLPLCHIPPTGSLHSNVIDAEQTPQSPNNLQSEVYKITLKYLAVLFCMLLPTVHVHTRQARRV